MSASDSASDVAGGINTGVGDEGDGGSGEDGGWWGGSSRETSSSGMRVGPARGGLGVFDGRPDGARTGRSDGDCFGSTKSNAPI